MIPRIPQTKRLSKILFPVLQTSYLQKSENEHLVLCTSVTRGQSSRIRRHAVDLPASYRYLSFSENFCKERSGIWFPSSCNSKIFLLWYQHKWDRKGQPYNEIPTLLSHMSFYRISSSEMDFLPFIVLLTTGVDRKFSRLAGWDKSAF